MIKELFRDVARVTLIHKVNLDLLFLVNVNGV